MGVVVALLIAVGIVGLIAFLPRLATAQDVRGLGDPEDDEKLVCPHCQKRGYVVSRRVQVKRGISGAKATGAVLTAGISLLGTGLARKEWTTRMRCSNCGTTWDV